jgi:Flp pilus assembly pilin Flp
VRTARGLVEYALILSLVAIVVLVALQFLGGSIKTILSTVGNSVGGPTDHEHDAVLAMGLFALQRVLLVASGRSVGVLSGHGSTEDAPVQT